MRRSFALACVMGLLALTGEAGAANTVTVNSVTKNGTTLRVLGESTFDNQPFVAVGSDPSADAPTAVPEAGGDLTGAEISSTNSGNLQFRIRVASMPALVSTAPFVLYGWNFCVSGGSCFELVWTRVTADKDTPNVNAPPRWYLYKCGDAACTPAQQTAVSNAQAQVFASDKWVIMSVPLADMNAAPGATITGKAVDTAGTVFSALGGPHPSLMQRGSGDGIATVSDYTVAGKEVSLVIGPRGQPPASVAYDSVTVTPNEDNMWTANLDVSQMAGNHEVYVRSCLGSGNCSYTSRQVTI